ncbi:DUF1196 domain-containing protein [Vibrio cholerae]|nr:DUF1196 domain-containing protein [Vibrio cholerae]RNE75466.1 DUF1196 domain-containing protein [Vibrio cholerae]
MHVKSKKNFRESLEKPNARLRGWQRITPNSNTTTETTAAQWDWKRHALTVPLEAFVMCVLLMSLVQLQ